MNISKLTVFCMLLTVSLSTHAVKTDLPTDIRGFHIGMTESEFGKETWDMECGIRGGIVNFDSEDDSGQSLSASFFDGKLYLMQYTNHLAQFTSMETLKSIVKEKYGEPASENKDNLFYADSQQYNFVQLISMEDRKDSFIIMNIADGDIFEKVNSAEFQAKCSKDRVKLP